MSEEKAINIPQFSWGNLPRLFKVLIVSNDKFIPSLELQKYEYIVCFTPEELLVSQPKDPLSRFSSSEAEYDTSSTTNFSEAPVSRFSCDTSSTTNFLEKFTSVHNVFKYSDIEGIPKLIEIQLKRLQRARELKTTPPLLLVVFDTYILLNDSCYSIEKGLINNQSLRKLICNSRQYNIELILIVPEYVRLLSPSLHIQLDCIIISSEASASGIKRPIVKRTIEPYLYNKDNINTVVEVHSLLKDSVSGIVLTFNKEQSFEERQLNISYVK